MGLLASVLALGGLASAPARASSTATSSALDSLSTSVGVASGALSGSLSSVSPGKAQVAQGPYRIVALRRSDEAPQWVWLDLQPAVAAAAEPSSAEAANPEPWRLRLPTAVADAAGLDRGDVLTVRTRPYGLGVWPQAGGAPLYLVLHDDWAHAMAARPLDGPSGGAPAR